MPGFIDPMMIPSLPGRGQNSPKGMHNTEDDPSRSPPAETFSAGKVKNEVLADAIQHPLTLWPLVPAAFAGSYAFFIAPFLGFALFPVAIAIALLGGGTSAGSFWFHFFRRGPEYARQKVQRFLEEKEQQEAIAFERLEAELARGFDVADSSDGKKEFAELTHEYRELKGILERYRERNIFSVAQIALSAQQAYHEGLQVLMNALDVVRVIQATDDASLRAEMHDLEEQIAELRRSGAQDQRIALKEEMRASHEKRLAAFAELPTRRDALFQQADACEAALQSVRLALPLLKTGISQDHANEAAGSLLRTIESVRKMQGMLNPDTQEEDQYYQNLGQEKRR